MWHSIIRHDFDQRYSRGSTQLNANLVIL